MSILFFKARYPDASILAFEPDSLSFSSLRHAIESNGLTGVSAEQAAVTEHGTVVIFRNDSDPGSIVASVDRAWGGDVGTEVQAVRLSDRINSTVDFLKIDIEGAEYGVVCDLAGSGTIRWVGEAAIEYHNLPEMLDALERMIEALEGAGFDVTAKPSTDGSPTGVIRLRHP
jgi:FkbM family methyltransferase